MVSNRGRLLSLHSAHADLLLPPLLLLFLPMLAGNLETKTITIQNPINGTDMESLNLKMLGDASVNGGALQLTPDTLNGDRSTYLVNKSGRVLLNTPFKLWEEEGQVSSSSHASHNPTGSTQSKTVVSFSTSFDFGVFRVNKTTPPGEGMAFLITADVDSMPEGSHSQFLGLTNESTDGNDTNHLVAVEFDTVRQLPSGDPDDNHVGLDINSVKSTVSRSLDPFNLTIARSDNKTYRVWIDYNGTERHIYVYMDFTGNPKPQTPVLNATLDLGEHLAQQSYFGFSGSTSTQYELNCVLSWNLTVEVLPEDPTSPPTFLARVPWTWHVGVRVPVIGVTVVVVMAVVCYCYVKRRVVKRDVRLKGTLKSLPGTPREFKYKVLKSATGNFDEKNKRGQGGFGTVYRGLIPGENVDVAVKMFFKDTKQEDFLAELTIINRLRHRHLVRLLGWCHENGKLLLVYDYMTNGSLDDHLFSPAPGRNLPWDLRYQVVAGVAAALHYLHDEYDERVVHRDIKPSNVLLDANFKARLGDFGLARALDPDRTSYGDPPYDRFPGTPGYIAPECFYTGKATRRSDVFAFGTLLLEVVSGRRAHSVDGFLIDWVWHHHRSGSLLDAVDPRLFEGGGYDADDAQRLLLLGLACCHSNPGDRPNTQAIVHIISRSVPPPEVPLFRPPFAWPPSVTPDDDDGEAATAAIATTSSTRDSSTFYSLTGGRPPSVTPVHDDGEAATAAIATTGSTRDSSTFYSLTGGRSPT